MSAQFNVVDISSGEVIKTDLVMGLPALPRQWPAAHLVTACDGIWNDRYEIVASPPPVQDAHEAMRRAAAIREYVTDREQKASANRALRVLEMAVGAALGPPPGQGARTDIDTSPHAVKSLGISQQDHGRLWALTSNSKILVPALEETPHASRRDLLNRIDMELIARKLPIVNEIERLMAEMEGMGDDGG